jgi:hypothetical protein
MAEIRFGDDTVQTEAITGESNEMAMAPTIWEARFVVSTRPIYKLLRGHGGSEQMAVERLFDLRDQRDLLKTLDQG